MWLELTKYLFYLSFILNIACGVWVFFGIVRWIKELNQHEPLRADRSRRGFPLRGLHPSAPHRKADRATTPSAFSCSRQFVFASGRVSPSSPA